MIFRYAGYAKDKQMRDKSTSGGMSAIFAEFIIKQGGVVYGVAYSDDFRRVIYKRVKSMDDFYKYISTSKYSSCELPDMKSIKNDLDNQLKVLFFGSGCMVKILNDFLKAKYNNLFTINIYCHGYPKKSTLNQFIETEENIEKSKVILLNMRYKHLHDVYVEFENGNHHIYPKSTSQFFPEKDILSNCNECKLGYTHEVSDITLGSFWRYTRLHDIKKYQNFEPKMGTNIIYVNTQTGLDYFNAISSNIELIRLTSDMFK